MLKQLKELRSHLDIAAAAGLGASRANNINELESWPEGTELSRRHASPSGSKPYTSQMETFSIAAGNIAYNMPSGSSKKLVRGPKPSKPLVASTCSPARTPRRGLWGGTERRDLSAQRPPGAIGGKSEGSRAPSSPQASSVSFQDMLQEIQDAGERL